VPRGVPTLIAIILCTGLLALAAWLTRGFGPSPTTPTTTLAPATTTADTNPAVLPNASVRIITANIRMDEPDDGPNAWQKRRELLVKTLLKYGPDIIGCQEVSPAQGAYLIKQLNGYSHYPRGTAEGTATTRTSSLAAELEGTLSGLNTVFFREDRLDLLEGANGLVLPDQLQQIPTENTFFTLLVLADHNSRVPKLIVVDTHLRHGDKFAAQCAARIRAIIAEKRAKYPGAQVVVIGDMNHDRGSKSYAALTAVPETDGGLEQLVDTFDYSKKAPKELWGNWHGFTGITRRGLPTDLIFAAGPMEHSPAEILRDHDADNHFPSDHFFVMTTLSIR